MDFLLGKGISFVIPARRNSKLYEVEISLDEHFFYRGRLIKAGKAKARDRYKYCFYLFEDVTLKAEEEVKEVNLYKMLDEGRIKSRGELNRRLERVGKILL